MQSLNSFDLGIHLVIDTYFDIITGQNYVKFFVRYIKLSKEEVQTVIVQKFGIRDIIAPFTDDQLKKKVQELFNVFKSEFDPSLTFGSFQEDLFERYELDITNVVFSKKLEEILLYGEAVMDPRPKVMAHFETSVDEFGELYEFFAK